jgi:hypothetical protein
LTVFFPILICFVLIIPPWIKEERQIFEHGTAVQKDNIGFFPIFSPPSELPKYIDSYRISHSEDYQMWNTLLSVIAFLNISFYVLTKNDSKIE